MPGTCDWFVLRSGQDCPLLAQWPVAHMCRRCTATMKNWACKHELHPRPKSKRLLEVAGHRFLTVIRTRYTILYHGTGRVRPSAHQSRHFDGTDTSGRLEPTATRGRNPRVWARSTTNTRSRPFDATLKNQAADAICHPGPNCKMPNDNQQTTPAKLASNG